MTQVYIECTFEISIGLRFCKIGQKNNKQKTLKSCLYKEVKLYNIYSSDFL